jgi:predicted nucleic acid-binding protein
VILYVDTSAVAKAVLLEAGTDRVERWFHQAEQIASSVITYAEACAALDRNHRLRGGHDADALRARLVRLDAQWSEFLVLPVDELSAGRVALRHHLRGMDAVQLGAALRLRDSVSAYAPDAQVAFAAFDRRLLEAAEREGFATLGGPLE